MLTRSKIWTWNRIWVGGGLDTADKFREALENRGCQVSDKAYEIISQCNFKSVRSKVDLALVEVGVDIGHEFSILTLTDMYGKALERGLKLCPTQTAMELLLQLPKEHIPLYLTVGMEPMTGSSNEELAVLILGQEIDYCWLDGVHFPTRDLDPCEWWSNEHLLFSQGSRVVFCR